MPSDKQPLLRQLPKVDAVASSSELDEARRRLGAEHVVRLVRDAVREERERVLATGEAPELGRVLTGARARVDAMLASRARRVINAGGVVLHTNLGRAPLSSRAVEAVAASAAGYTSVEIDLQSGRPAHAAPSPSGRSLSCARPRMRWW
jgi:L-seryl-tRNA(Ser) seleniumtransferase